MTAATTSRPDAPPASLRALRSSAVALVTASWISAALFGLYIVAFYLTAIRSRQMDRWNQNLSGLYDPHHPAAIAAMAAHLAMGAVILILGPVQLLSSVRRRWPLLHRWLGRVYVATSAVAGLGGLAFIVIEGTIGGAVMDLGFGLYGALITLAACETYRHARALRFDLHRAWGLRLFALALGSWLYRMDYGFWLLIMHGLGHTQTFRGPFDRAMAFLFYLPNLALVELFLRARVRSARTPPRLAATAVLTLTTLVVAVGTYYFVRFYWGPGILNGLL